MVGTNLRLVRKHRGMSRAELAVKSGVSFGTVQAVEQGRQDPRSATLRRFADALDVPTDQLVGRAPLDFAADTLALLAQAS